MFTDCRDEAAVTPVPTDYESTVEQVVAHRDGIAAYVRKLGRRGPIRNVYLVGSGASYFATWSAKYLLDAHATGCSAWHLTSGEFVAHPPRRLGPDSLVVAASHSGGTLETVEAARLAAKSGAAVAAITRDERSALAEATGNDDAVFAYPTDSAIVESRMLLFQHFAHALTESDLNGWARRSAALPRALRAVKDEIGAEAAIRLAEEELVYVVGAGPSFGVANAFACCYLQEMQWVHAAALPAADFFHGPFEAVGHRTPVVVLLAEDGSRAITERALRFLQRYSGNVVALDSKDFRLPGVEPRDRAEISTFALGSAARRMADQLAAARGHALSTRRYMRRVDY